MPIAITDRIVALLVTLRDEDLAALPPAERRRLADQCRHVASRADRQEPKAGVLAQLRQGRDS
jgi:hypothetical protein